MMFNILFTVLCLKFTDAVDMINLNGLWNLKNTSKGDSLPAKVPGGVHTALMDYGIIGDPFYRTNDEKYLWVGRTDWTYYTTFNVSEKFLAKQTILLVCDGLDTISVTYINNKEVGRSVNMFVRYIYDVKSALKVGENTIRIEFTSAVTYGKRKQEELGYRVPPDCPPINFRGECNGNKVRKMQSSFSWDWAPAFVTQGIWKNIYLESFSSAVIRDVTSETIKDKAWSWLLKIEVFLDCTTDRPLTGMLEYNVGNTDISGQKKVSLTGDEGQVSYTMWAKITKDTPIETWWPNGYGKQTLYPLKVTYTDTDKSETSTKVVKIGFRTVELVQELVTMREDDGRTFYFRINGQPIFLKGSNWIPADSFLERVTKDRLYNYLKSAADVHMNTLRVWGGGIYESDDFYEIADEFGILIWQDFAFACALYPTDGPFLQTVSEEITYQIRRIKHHPSLLVYNGNNEIENGLKNGWWPGVLGNQRYAEDYLKLFIDVIYKIVKREDPNRPFLSSSPSNGVQTQIDGWISTSYAGMTKYGDVHEYRYSRLFYNDSRYKTPRMASEYGLQSFPSYETLNPVYEEGDMFYKSPLNEHRQHHINGNWKMINQIKMYLNPPNSTDQLQKFKDIIYCTQIDQAIAMRTETEHYRRWQSEINQFGEGYTMGALYWMFKEIWQAPTWSSLEYGGKWKMLHYYAQKFFAPLLISPYIDADVLKVYVVIDEVPIYEQRDKQTQTLQFCPGTRKHFHSREPSAGSAVSLIADCDYGTMCWNHSKWCLLAMCCIFLVVYALTGILKPPKGQGKTKTHKLTLVRYTLDRQKKFQSYRVYTSCRRGRSRRQLWSYTVLCLIFILFGATIHIISVQDPSRRHLKHKHGREAEKERSGLVGILYVQLYTWESLEVKYTWKIPFKLEKVAQMVHQVRIYDMLEEGQCSGMEYCFVVFHLGNRADGPSSWYPLTPFRNVQGLKKANIEIFEVSKTSHTDEYQIVLTTDAVAPFVWLEAYGIKGRFCNNGFLMFEETKSILFYSWEATDLKSLKDSLTVKSLMDIYH